MDYFTPRELDEVEGRLSIESVFIQGDVRRLVEHARELLKIHEEMKRPMPLTTVPAPAPRESILWAVRLGAEEGVLTERVKEKRAEGYELVEIVSHKDVLILHFRRP